MAFNHPNADNSVIQGVVSVRSSMFIGHPSTFDNQLITLDQYAKLKANNQIFHPEIKMKNDVIIEILKGHPLYTALTEVVLVPLIYVQQF